MTIYTFPSTLLQAERASFRLASFNATSPQSAFNSYSSVSGPTTEFWRAMVTIVQQEVDDWRAVRALIHQLRGGRNKVRLFDPASYPMRGAGASTPTVNISAAASAGSTSISIKNLTASQSASFKADDQISIAENLYSVMADAPSNGSGVATVEILPALRIGVSIGDVVSLVRPTGLFRLVSTDVPVIVPPVLSEPLQLEFAEDPAL